MVYNYLLKINSSDVLEAREPFGEETAKGNMKEQEVMEEELDEVDPDIVSRDPKQFEYTESYFSTGNFSREQPSLVSVYTIRQRLQLITAGVIVLIQEDTGTIRTELISAVSLLHSDQLVNIHVEVLQLDYMTMLKTLFSWKVHPIYGSNTRT